MNLKKENEWLKNEILESKYCTIVCVCVCAYTSTVFIKTYSHLILLSQKSHLFFRLQSTYLRRLELFTKSKHSYALIIFTNDSAPHSLAFLNILRPLEFFGCSVVIFLPIYFSP